MRQWRFVLRQRQKAPQVERSDDKTDPRESIQHTEPDDGSCSEVPETEFGTDGEEDRRTRATSGRRRWR
jgi:hypothetical protein